MSEASWNFSLEVGVSESSVLRLFPWKNVVKMLFYKTILRRQRRRTWGSSAENFMKIFLQEKIGRAKWINQTMGPLDAQWVIFNFNRLSQWAIENVCLGVHKLSNLQSCIHQLIIVLCQLPLLNICTLCICDYHNLLPLSTIFYLNLLPLSTIFYLFHLFQPCLHQLIIALSQVSLL